MIIRYFAKFSYAINSIFESFKLCCKTLCFRQAFRNNIHFASAESFRVSRLAPQGGLQIPNGFGYSACYASWWLSHVGFRSRKYSPCNISQFAFFAFANCTKLSIPLEVVSTSRLVQNGKHLLKLILFSWPITSNKCLADCSTKQTFITISLLKQCRSKLVVQFENGLSFWSGNLGQWRKTHGM